MSHLQYFKTSVVVRECLRPLKGARVSTFFALASNEAEICLGHSHGLTARTIAEWTGYGLRTTHYALDYLCRYGYATKLEARGEQSQSLYRVSAYAWFGNPPPPYVTRNPARECAPAGNCRGMQSSAPVVVVNTSSSIPESRETEKQQQAQFEASRAIFVAANVGEPALEGLARTVAPSLAREWTERLEYAPESFTDPVGFMVKRLLHDPTAEPHPAWQKKRPKRWYDDEFAKFVHGSPEHAQYCREHPDEVDCDCGKKLPEDEE